MVRADTVPLSGMGTAVTAPGAAASVSLALMATPVTMRSSIWQEPVDVMEAASPVLDSQRTSPIRAMRISTSASLSQTGRLT